MIHEIGVELAEGLKDRKCPFTVVDGPERTKAATFGRERVVIEYDEDADDAFEAVRGNHKNPKYRATLRMAAKITIYAQSAKPNAMFFEHQRRARAVADLVFVAMMEIASKRRNQWGGQRGRFKRPEELQESERDGGAVYEIRFWFERGVFEQTFKGEITPSGTIGSVSNTTKVTRAGAPQESTPETGCGG